jgi:uncharacterized membrane protein HdeD (DUF308 family)
MLSVSSVGRAVKRKEEMNMRSVAPMKAAKIGYIILSIVFCLLGIWLFAMPALLTSWLGRLLGISMIVFGIIKLIGYLSRDLFRLAFQYDLAFGILLIILGIIVLINPNGAMSFLGIIFGISALTDGLFKIQIALDAKQFGIRLWWLILLLALVTCFLGAALIFQPVIGALVLTMLVGASLFLDGVLNLSVALCAVKIIHHQQPDVVEIETFEINEDEK